MELMRIFVTIGESYALQGHTQRVQMIPFTGRVESPLFTGDILPGGVDTQTYAPGGSGCLSARYMLRGRDCDGVPCSLYIDNRAQVRPGAESVTHPRITTDSKALRWLENACLTGRICPKDDHLEIVISCEDTPLVQRVVIRRAGLELRGRIDKPGTGRYPLVMILHGFGGHMDDGCDGLYQRLSQQLVAAGMATLRFDFNGHGQSEGDFTAMTPYNEVEDAAAFLQYAQGLDWVESISVMGHSQGGVIAGMLAGYYPDVIRRLVMLAPAASLKTDALKGVCMHAVYDTEHIPASVDVDGVHHVGGLYFRMAKSLPIYEVTGQFRGPGLAVACGQDGVVDEEAIRRYAERDNLRFVRYASLDHGMGGREHAAMAAAVTAFLGEKD